MQHYWIHSLNLPTLPACSIWSYYLVWGCTCLLTLHTGRQLDKIHGKWNLKDGVYLDVKSSKTQALYFFHNMLFFKEFFEEFANVNFKIFLQWNLSFHFSFLQTLQSAHICDSWRGWGRNRQGSLWLTSVALAELGPLSCFQQGITVRASRENVSLNSLWIATGGNTPSLKSDTNVFY